MKPYILSVALTAALLFCAMTTLASEPPASARVDFSAMGPQGPQTFDRFIIQYRAGATPTTQSLTQSLNGAARSALARNGAAAVQVQQARAIGTGRTRQVRMSRKLSHSQAQDFMLSVAANPDVEYIGPDVMHAPVDLPNDPLLPNQWHYSNPVGGANVPAAWDAGASGEGIVVAVLDTGVTTHPDLAANLLPGYDMILDKAISGRTTDGRVPGGSDTGDWVVANQCGTGSPASNSSWHGTHVSGTVVEVTNNALGGAGVAPKAKVVPVRVLGHCGGLQSDIMDAITWASGGTVEGLPANPHPAEVINMSLSGAASCNAPYQEAIDAAIARGTTIVVAAGNNNADATQRVPANCKNVITVGSTGISGKRASYSNYGTRVDIAAPGGGINDGANQTQGYVWSTWNKGTTTPGEAAYVGMVGTSMAAPHVAAVVALVQSVLPKPRTPADIAALLKQTARAFPVTQDQPLGAGIVDAGTAVVTAKTGGQALANGVIKANLNAPAGGSLDYVIAVGAGAQKLSITSYGGSGEVKLLLKRDAAPTATSYDVISQRPGNNQLINLTTPAAGTYFLKVLGVSEFSRLSVKATVL